MTVPADDYHALEALARYCGRNPASLDPLRFTPGLSTVTCRPRGGHDEEPVETVDALDFVARVLAHIPDPRRHLVHYYGAYSNSARLSPLPRRDARDLLLTQPLVAPNETAPLARGREGSSGL